MARPGRRQGGGDRPPWQLPDKYDEMTPREQAATLRACILRYLRDRGAAVNSVIAKEIGAPNPDTVKKALEWLSTTQQVYSEQYPGSNPVFFPNGRLAHPLLQGQVQVGLREYVIRTYMDRLTGKNVTVTEYSLTSGEKTPKGGIRVDLADLEALIQELRRIADLAKASSVVDGGLVATE